MAHIQHAFTRLLVRAAPLNWRGLLLLTPRVTHTQFKWPGAFTVFGPDGIPLKNYRYHLGQSYPVVVLDFSNGFHADAFAALAETVHGGGILIIVEPANSVLFNHLLKHTTDLNQQGLVERTDIASEDLQHWEPDLPPLPSPSHALTLEQTKVVDALQTHYQQHPQEPALLTAARGRGKSTVLGHLAHRLIDRQPDLKVIICAPSQRHTLALYAQLPAESASCVKYAAPDELLTAQPHADLVLIDEAASLPRYIIEQLVQRYPGAVMATTTQGYETCGRGFLLQFCQNLHAQHENFLRCTLTQAQRYADSCPLEQWINHGLFLTSTESVSAHFATNADECRYQAVHAEVLLEEAPDVLENVFHLLMDAHYQTSPNDLRLLTDDPAQHLLLQWQNDKLTGVIWLSDEQIPSPELAAAIVRGERRPAGNLLPQALARHFFSPAPAFFSYRRIVRIAILPECQRRGLGGKLLQVAMTKARENQIDILGTSFGYTLSLYKFWINHQFAAIRVGSKPDKVTGRAAMLMLMPINPQQQITVNQWHQYYLFEHNKIAEAPKGYRALQKRRIAAFAAGSLDFPAVIDTLRLIDAQRLADFPLLEKALQPDANWSTLASTHGMSGRKDLFKHLRALCLKLSTTI